MTNDRDDEHDELARRVQAVMHEHDHEAPDPRPLDLTDPAGATPARRPDGRRRVIVGGLAVAAVAAAAFVSVAIPHHQRHPAVRAGGSTPAKSTFRVTATPTSPAGTGPTTPAPIGTESPVATRTLPNGSTQVETVLPIRFVPVQFRGLRLLYPAMGGGPCPDRNLTGVMYYGPKNNTYFDSCSAVPDPDNPVMVLAATDSNRPLDISPATTPTTIDGVPALTGSKNGYDYIVVPSLKVVARFSVGTPERTADVTPTASIITKDTYGCPLHIDAAVPPHTTIAGAATDLVPGNPVSVIDCQYTNSDVATPGVQTDITHDAEQTRSSLDGLRRTSASCPVLTDRDRHLLFTYADGSVLDVRMRSTKCDDMVFTNGNLTRVGDSNTVPVVV